VTPADHPEPREASPSLSPRAGPWEPRASASGAPFWGLNDLALFVSLALPCLLLGALAWRAFALLTRIRLPVEEAAAIPAQFIGYGLWFASLRLLFRIRYNAPFWQSLAWNFSARTVSLSMLLGFSLAIGVSVAGAILRTPQIDSPMRHLLEDPSSALMVGAMAVTLGPVCEELAFRGFLLPLLVPRIGLPAAIVGAALPFALLHGPQYSWAWQYVLLITIAGCAFGWMRWRTNSTAAAAIMHAVYNLTFLSFYVLQQRLGGR